MERWSFLSGWCEVLKGAISYSNALKDKTEVWDARHQLVVKLPMRGDFIDFSRKDPDYIEDEEVFWDYFEQAREALALLAAVEHVDKRAYKHLLKHFCEADIGKEGEERFEKVPAEFMVIMDFGLYDQHTVEYPLVKLCGVHQREHPSRKYLEALDQIAAMGSLSAGVDLEVSVTVYFPGPEGHSIEPANTLLDVLKAEQMIKQQWEEYELNSRRQDVPPGKMRCTLAMQPMVVNFFTMTFNSKTTALDTAVAMERLVRDNVRFSQLNAVPVDCDDDADECENRKTHARLMQAVFNSTSRTQDLANTPCRKEGRPSQPSHIDRVGLVGSATPYSYFQAMCSALPVNQTTRNVSLSFDDSPSDPDFSAIWYKWLGYGLLSKRARSCSSIYALRLMIGRMSVEDVQAFTSMRTSEHPEEELCGTRRGRVDERDATLREGAPIRWEFDDDGVPDWTYMRFDDPIRFVRTFSDDSTSKWVDAIVPGCGRCQVRRRDLTVDTSVAYSRPQKLISLSVNFSGWEGFVTDGLPELISSIGSSLRSLDLHGPRVDVAESFIFQHCPHLDELSLGGGLLDVQLNAQEYREHCHAHGELTQEPVDWHDIGALATFLSDAKNPMAKCVRRLRVHLVRQNTGWGQQLANYSNRGFEADLEPLLQMLRVNNSLEYFEVVVRSDYEEHMAKFREFHLQPILRARGPLPTECKIAFLSVFSTARAVRRKTSQPRHHLREPNQEAVSNIFAFAAPPVLRQVYFRTAPDLFSWMER